MKVTIELDPKDPEDAETLRRILFPAAEVASVRALGKKLSQAAAELGEALPGERPKLTPKQKGQVAAKARWEKKKGEPRLAVEAPKPPPPKPKAKKPAKPPPPPVQEKKQAAQDFSQAKEESPERLSQAPGETFQAPGSAQPYVPDGRELLDGSFELPAPQPKSEEEYVREVDRIASEHGNGG